jgi:hypothetical protein
VLEVLPVRGAAKGGPQVSDRDQIREILASVGIAGDELEWMTASCPSIAHALDESDRRMDKAVEKFAVVREQETQSERALTVRCRKCGARIGVDCSGVTGHAGFHVQRIREAMEV